MTCIKYQRGSILDSIPSRYHVQPIMTLKTFLLITLLASLPTGLAQADDVMPPASAETAAPDAAPGTDPAASTPTPEPDTPVASTSEPTPAPEASLANMIQAMNKFLTEEEMEMIYDYLWDSSIAAIKGNPEDVSLPPELAFKFAILQRRVVKEGGHYLEGLARKMEKDLDRWYFDLFKPSPPVPYRLPGEGATPKAP
jgi:hypothetical protein